MWKLNVGCGQQILPNYVNADIRKLEGVDVIGDVKCLPFKDSAFEKLWASDILEHNPHLEIEKILKEWHRILKKDGVLALKVPNMRTIASNYIHNLIDCSEFSRLVYGNQEDNNIANFHKSGFDSTYLNGLLKRADFKIVKLIEKPSYPDQNNMVIKVKKK